MTDSVVHVTIQVVGVCPQSAGAVSKVFSETIINAGLSLDLVLDFGIKCPSGFKMIYRFLSESIQHLLHIFCISFIHKDNH